MIASALTDSRTRKQININEVRPMGAPNHRDCRDLDVPIPPPEFVEGPRTCLASRQPIINLNLADEILPVALPFLTHSDLQCRNGTFVSQGTQVRMSTIRVRRYDSVSV